MASNPLPSLLTRSLSPCGNRYRSIWSFEISAPMVISVIFSVSHACHPIQKLGYPFRKIGKDGGDQTLARPGIQQNGGLRVSDPSPIAGKGCYPSRRFFFSQEARIVIRQAWRIYSASYPAASKRFMHSETEKRLMMSPSAWAMVSRFLAAFFRKSSLSFENAISMGFMSGG